MSTTDYTPAHTWVEWVRTHRQMAGLTTAELADFVGVNRATAWRWETGRGAPDRAEVVFRVAAVLNRPPMEALAAAGMNPTALSPNPAHTSFHPLAIRLNRLLKNSPQRDHLEQLVTLLLDLYPTQGRRSRTTTRQE